MPTLKASEKLKTTAGSIRKSDPHNAQNDPKKPRKERKARTTRRSNKSAEKGENIKHFSDRIRARFTESGKAADRVKRITKTGGKNRKSTSFLVEIKPKKTKQKRTTPPLSKCIAKEKEK